MTDQRSIANQTHDVMADGVDRSQRTKRSWRVAPHIFWPGLVIGLLTMSVTIMTATLVLALSDPSFAVDPDYTNKARHWDAQAAAQRQSDALGWSASIKFGDAKATSDERAVRLTLIDSAGAPVDLAAVSVVLYHPVRSKEKQAVVCVEQFPGVYVGVFHPTRLGVWEIELTANRGDDVYLDHQQRWLVSLEP